MPTYDPLTDSQKELLQQFDSGPQVFSIAEQNARGNDFQYLQSLGLITVVEAVHVSQDNSRSTWRWKRTDKKLD